MTNIYVIDNYLWINIKEYIFKIRKNLTFFLLKRKEFKHTKKNRNALSLNNTLSLNIIRKTTEKTNNQRNNDSSRSIVDV